MPAVVDIGVPVYERATYIAKALEAIQAQTFTAWRATISEDGPGNPEVRAAVEPFLADERITHSPTGTRLGLPGNKTRLIRTGTAPYVALLDDDDLWQPEFLERRVAFLEEHPQCGFVFSEHVDIDERGETIGEDAFRFGAGPLSSEEFTRAAMEYNVVATPTMVVRRSAYESAGDAFDERFARICDYEMVLRLGIRFPVGYLRTRDAGYRLHAASMSHNHDGGIDFFRLVDHVDALLAEHLPQLRLAPVVRRRKRASALISAALDAIEAGDRGAALALVGRAARNDPRALLTLRAAGTLFGLVPGARSREWLGRTREAADARRAQASS